MFEYWLMYEIIKWTMVTEKSNVRHGHKLIKSGIFARYLSGVPNLSVVDQPLKHSHQ